MPTRISHHSELEELAAPEPVAVPALLPEGEVVEVVDGLVEDEVDEDPAEVDEVVAWPPAAVVGLARLEPVTAGAGRTVDEVGGLVGGELVVPGVDTTAALKATTCWEFGTSR